MGTWTEIRDGMAAALGEIEGLIVKPMMPKTIADPDVAVVLYGDPLVLPAGHVNRVSVGVRVIVRVSRGDLRDAQAALDQYLWPSGEKSIVAAVRAAPTLSATVDDTQWLGTGSVGTLEDGSIQADINFRCTVAS